MEIKGVNGQVDFDGQWVTIKRKGGMALLSQGLKGDKRIPLVNILSVQFKTANALTNGYIQFATAAGESGSGLFSATSDENSVMFTKAQQQDFENFRDQIESAIANRNHPAAPAVQIDLADQLAKLANLRDQGILTPEEFDAQKSKLLGL